jgi:hypothetical protein
LLGSSQEFKYPKKIIQGSCVGSSLEVGNHKKNFKEAMLVHHQHPKIPRKNESKFY